MGYLDRRGALRAALIASSLVLLGFVVLSNSAAAATPAPLQSSGNNAVSAVVSFNGVPVATHDSLSSAIVTHFSGQFTTVFEWASVGAPAYVNQGQVSILFFGASIGTSAVSVSQTGSGTITLNNSFSQNQYLYEGVYDLHAVLTDNGSTVFSENFFVWVQATDHLTVVNIVLLLIILLEIYEIAVLGSVKKAAAQLGLKPKSPPANPSPSAPAASSTEAPAEEKP